MGFAKHVTLVGHNLMANRPTADICCVDGCESAPRSRTAGYCEKHYYRKRRHGDPLATLMDMSGYDCCVICGKATARLKYCSVTCAVRQTRAKMGIDEQRARGRRYAAERKARKLSVLCESFDDRDVYQRDNWICQICG